MSRSTLHLTPETQQLMHYSFMRPWMKGMLLWVARSCSLQQFFESREKEHILIFTFDDNLKLPSFPMSKATKLFDRRCFINAGWPRWGAAAHVGCAPVSTASHVGGNMSVWHQYVKWRLSSCNYGSVTSACQQIKIWSGFQERRFLL